MTDTKGKVVIRFDGPPGHEGGRFVEVERDGVSINHGEWFEARDGYWLLVLPTEPGVETLKELVLANQSAAMNEMGRAKDAEAKLAVAEKALEKIQETCTTWKALDENMILCRETARKARDEIKLGTVDKGGVNKPPTSPKPDVVVKPQASKPPTSTRLAIDGFEQCLRDFDAIEAELFPKGVVFASWTTVANTRRWIADTILPALKKSGEGEAKKLLALAVAYLDRFGPPPPDHNCGHPDSCCDGDCTDFAQFCNDILEMKRAC